MQRVVARVRQRQLTLVSLTPVSTAALYFHECFGALAELPTAAQYALPLYSAAVFFSFFFFLAYSQRSQIGCLPYFNT